MWNVPIVSGCVAQRRSPGVAQLRRLVGNRWVAILRSLIDRSDLVCRQFEAGSLGHRRRGQSDERRPRGQSKKGFRPGRAGQNVGLKAPRLDAALGMPFSGRGPVLVAFTGAALGALPPSTMAEAFGLKGCRLPRRKIQRPGECRSGGMTSKYVTELPKQST